MPLECQKNSNEYDPIIAQQELEIDKVDREGSDTVLITFTAEFRIEPFEREFSCPVKKKLKKNDI